MSSQDVGRPLHEILEYQNGKGQERQPARSPLSMLDCSVRLSEMAARGCSCQPSVIKVSYGATKARSSSLTSLA